MPKLKLVLPALALVALSIPTTPAQAAITQTVLFNKGTPATAATASPRS